ncbi:hypothetical protein [Pseudoalteromonas piscicida]|uniref:hypothetical protein n=1 Tax=Pseudoalteromonas piscicida TaxID=43662 RepID=UPI003C7E378F
MQANNESIQLAKEYLEAVLTKDYENVEKFIEVSAYTKNHQLTLSDFIEIRFEKGHLNKESKAEFKNKFIAMGIPEEDLSEWLVGDLVKYFFVDYYQLYTGSLPDITTESIKYLSEVEDNGLVHILFNIEQSIELDEEYPLKQKYSDIRTVTIKKYKNKPIIVPPSNVKAHVEITLFGLVEMDWKSANKPKLTYL